MTIFCGAGNNAGDGYVLARLAQRAGFPVRVVALTPSERLAGDALRAYADFESSGGRAEGTIGSAALDSDLMVDAILGTGLDRDLEGAYARAVAAINGAGKPVLALDIPTGLHADLGMPLGATIHATVTLTFVGLKLGLYMGEAADYRGRIEFADLGVPAQAYAAIEAPVRRLDPGCVRQALPPRRRIAHKGAHGHVLCVGGAPGMSGAIRLAAEAALRAGAGLVRVATHPDSVVAVMAGRPEVMCHGVNGASELRTLVPGADAIVLGPGLGRSAWAKKLWNACVDCELPLVIDADGLNLLAESPRQRHDWLLTPHPGEAARLLATDLATIQADRIAAVQKLVGRYGGTVVLKGAGTLVATEGHHRVSLCDAGNPGMATAGMGDVLAGVLGALRVQGSDPVLAAEAGVFLHAQAGDDAARAGERGLLAGDLMPFIRKAVNPA